jgi:hypothetical protein
MTAYKRAEYITHHRPVLPQLETQMLLQTYTLGQKNIPKFQYSLLWTSRIVSKDFINGARLGPTAHSHFHAVVQAILGSATNLMSVLLERPRSVLTAILDYSFFYGEWISAVGRVNMPTLADIDKETTEGGGEPGRSIDEFCVSQEWTLDPVSLPVELQLAKALDG